MMNDFDKNGYIYLKEFLDEYNCNELTNLLKKLARDNLTTKDPQCPNSHSIYGNYTFDKLLEDLLPHFEKACGKKLLPTYSYARLYKPGEELKKHTDRPACEISATITLGFAGDIWSIYMAGNKIDMQVGDAVIYKGMEVEHWREQYVEGEWQAQVFLHYVDADGPYTDQKYDGRETLGVTLEGSGIEKELTDCAIFENHLSYGFCDNIIKTYSQESIHKEPPIIGHNKLNRDIRDTERVTLPLTTGLSATLGATGLNANNYWWQYNITHINQSELFIYKPGGHYNSHVDTVHAHDINTRKLTALAFLNDDFEGGQFFINSNGSLHYPPQSKGTVIVFPSYMVHGVEPVIKGTRYSSACWLAGPYFK